MHDIEALVADVVRARLIEKVTLTAKLSTVIHIGNKIVNLWQELSIFEMNTAQKLTSCRENYQTKGVWDTIPVYCIVALYGTDYKLT